MKVTVILIVISALGTVTKGLIQGRQYLEIIGRVEAKSKLQHDSDQPEY